MNKNHKIKLTGNWKVQSSEKTKASGVEISSAPAISSSWIPAKVPSTIMATLVANGIYKDPYFGENMKNIPTDAFQVPWWYANSFDISAEQAKKTVFLHTEGINYKANIWLNGQLIADAHTINGAFRHLKFNISEHLTEGKNTLAIEVIPPKPGDYTIGFVDWNIRPPDSNMGVFRDVYLHFNNQVSINNPYVETKVDKESLKSAEIKVSAELTNYSDKTISGKLKCTFGNVAIEKTISIAKNSTVLETFQVTDFPELKINDPKLWWPNTMGEANLHDLNLSFEINDTVSDSSQITFGIREVEDYINKDGHRGYKINGKKVLIKGGGWTDDLFLQDTHESLKAQIDYVKHMNLNTIRLEGFWGKDHQLYDLCDQNGILIMVGWSCQWEHEHHLGKPVDPRYGGITEADDIELIAQSWEEQVIWLRRHPSIFVWTVGSDLLPHPDLEKKYIESFKKYDSTRPYLNSTGGIGSEQGIISSTEIISELSGSSCVKMLGPYAYTPPNYWFTNTNLGGAYGFNTETCPGANVPPLASIKKTIPEQNLWPIDKLWEFHCGTDEFSTLDRATKAIEKRYGKATDVEDYAYKSQILNYELMRPMFESFIAHQPKSTGIIQWMLNSAWPEMYWQLYDSFLQPNGAFYAVKKACNTIHAIYRYGKNDIYLANNNLNGVNDLKVAIRLFDIDAKEIFVHEWSGDIPGNTSKQIFELPEIPNSTEVSFLDLRTYNKQNSLIDSNFYWLSAKEDVLDYEAGKTLEWEYHTPSKEYADYTSLKNLPEVTLNHDYKYEENDEEGKITLRLKNPSNSIAFFIALDVIDPKTSEPVLPIFWDENYLSLLPNEERILTARFSLTNLIGQKPELVIEGWNIKKITIR
jgi:exo-1,4-beta-D-glucosaminidase